MDISTESSPFHDDINVASDCTDNGVTLNGLDRVGSLGIGTKVLHVHASRRWGNITRAQWPFAYQCKGNGCGSPSINNRKRPCLEHFLCLLVNSHDRVTSDTKETRNKLASITLLFLTNKEVAVHAQQKNA